MTKRPGASDRPGPIRRTEPTDAELADEERLNQGIPQRHDLSRLVGHNFREARRRTRLSQMQVAELIGTHGSYIGTIERGDANITLGMLARLAAVVGVTPTALMAEPTSEQRLVEALQAGIQSWRATHTMQGSNLSDVEAILEEMLRGKHRQS